MNAVPYLKDPLVVLGFVMFLAFLIGRQFWNAALVRGAVPEAARFRVLGLVVRHGFVLGLLLCWSVAI